MNSKELQAALDAAEAAAVIIRSMYQRNLTVQTKADASPVTEADVKAEEAIRAILTERFPDYGFYGEETGQHALDAENLWLVDPIDGTKAFVRDARSFRRRSRSGAEVAWCWVSRMAPAYGELAWAEEGTGAYLNGKRIHVSHDERACEHDRFHRQSGRRLARSAQWQQFGELIPRVSRIRGYGDFVHYHLLARGALDVVIESDVNILDIAALTVIVREAGGRFTDLRGGEVDLETTSVLATNGALHETISEALRV